MAKYYSLDVINLGAWRLPVDAHPMHRFPYKFLPLAILPPLNEETVSDVPIEEAEEAIPQEEEEAKERDDLEV